MFILYTYKHSFRESVYNLLIKKVDKLKLKGQSILLNSSNHTDLTVSQIHKCKIKTTHIESDFDSERITLSAISRFLFERKQKSDRRNYIGTRELDASVHRKTANDMIIILQIKQHAQLNLERFVKRELCCNNKRNGSLEQPPLH